MKKRILLFLSALLTTMVTWSQVSITLETLPESALGQQAFLTMNLDNEETVKGFQADVTLPEFITFNNVAPQVTTRTSGFEVAYRRISEHQMRIVVSSANNGRLTADSAAVVKFNVTVADVEVVEAYGQTIAVTQATAILENYRKTDIPNVTSQALETKPSFVLRYEIDGTEFYRDTLMVGETVPSLGSVPTKEGHTFSGWSELPETMPAKDVTIIGSFAVNRYKVTYILDGETFRTDSVTYGTTVPTPEVPAKPGYNFSGWGELPATMPAKDLTFTGNYVINKDNKFNVIYMVDSVEYKRTVVSFGDSIKVEPIPTKEGHTFSGWSEVPETMPLHDVTVTGTFIANRYTLLYILDGVEYSADSIAYGTPLIQKDTPIKEGHTFSGWSELPATMPAQDVTVEGTFTVNCYRLVYLLDGAEYSVDSIAYGTTLVQKEALSKEGHTFSGWSELPATMPAQDVTVEGTFSVNCYRLVYLLDGAEYSVDSIAYGTTLVQKEALSKEGHTFSGWSELPVTMPAEDVMVTGSFTINKYLLAFVLDGDTIVTDSVTYGMNFTTPEIPAKEGYTFSGWGEVPEVMPAEDVTLIGEYRLNENQTDVQGLTYRLNDARDAFVVSGYTADLVADVKVPETLYGLPVNAVQDKALYGAVGLETIFVPASVSQVGTQVFGGCYGLLVLEWDATVSLRAECFDEAEAYGNMLVFTASATDFVGNVVVNGVSEEITLMDGKPFRNPKAFTAKRISYSREFTKKTKVGISSGWEGIILPFDVQHIVCEKSELLPFGLADFTTSLPCWIAEMQPRSEFALVEKITANTPFIMEVPNCEEYDDWFNIEGTVYFEAEDAEVMPTMMNDSSSMGDFLLRGTYENVAATPYVYALNEENYTATDGNVFMPGGVFVADLRDIRPFEAYAYHVQLTRSRYLSIGTKDSATGIPMLIWKDASLGDIYTIQGVKVKDTKSLPAGIYIQGGKKFIVK